MPGNYVTATSIRTTGITLVVLTSIIAGVRIIFAYEKRKGFHWEDGWLLAAFCIFIVIASLYMNAIPIMFRLEALGKGQIELYPTVADDGLMLQKTFFVTTSGLWICLWCVKFSLMAVYKRLMAGLPRYIMVWWALIVLCVVVRSCLPPIRSPPNSLSQLLAGAITSSMLSCSSMKAWFTAGACSTPRDIYASTISLWYSYAVDVLTDLLGMIPGPSSC